MGETIVSMQSINKSFPGVKALDNVRFELESGEVMALLGENGAGKSTLVKILSGVYARDSGTMEIFGKPYGDLSPKQAQAAGIAIIHQELNMCRHLTVAENMFLGREKTQYGVLSNAVMEQEAQKILSELKIEIDPAQVVGDLTISKQQMVEIAKALSVNARILVMDEPTSSLTSKEIDDLFRIIRALKESGCGIIYISHRLEELQYIADRVTIMRDGQYVASMRFKDTNVNEIITHMVGREIKEKFPRLPGKRGKEVLTVKNLNAGRMVRNVNLTLYEGEVVGLAGLVGAGRTETTRAIFGIDPKESGEIWLDGRQIKITCPRDAIKAGVVLAPEDRKKDGLCTKLSIRHNLALPNLDLICGSAGVVNRKKEDALCEKAMSSLSVKASGVETDAGNLSGGNQQKIVVGKWLARNSRVVIFDEPTRGIDVAAKVEIYNIINTLKSQGIAVMIVSSEMPEVLGISDRIVVMCDGRVTGEVMADETSQSEILTYATRFDSKAG
ncbi:MAG: sugar ABC transporter ATP-binding protein [Clostridiales bacterium]|jgi:ribose transport system ATP-binding protein|nr:sugar ABC transporter ATP-binding protein [Clostridiales bacterium]